MKVYNNTRKKRLLRNFYAVSFIVLCLLQSGCALELAEALSVEEAGVIGGLSESEMATIASQEAIVFEELPTTAGRLNIQLADVRLMETIGERPRLYINTPGGPRIIGEVENSNSIRLIRNGELKRVPGRLYRIKGNLVNVRSSKVFDQSIYNVKYKLRDGQIVLVLSENNGWFTVWLGENKLGYVKGSSGLIAILASTNTPEKKSASTIFKNCEVCAGDGYVSQLIKCPVCDGIGHSTCYNCQGAKQFVCYNCKGAKGFVCYNCHGDKKFVCYNCTGAKGFVCYNCSGLGKTSSGPCYICNQTGHTPCYICNQTGAIPCDVCNRSGYLPCNVCNQSGYTPCYICGQTGFIDCYTCSKTGRIQNKILCNKCMGTGKTPKVS